MPLAALIVAGLIAAVYLASSATSSSSGSSGDDSAGADASSSSEPSVVSSALGAGGDLVRALGQSVSKLWTPPAAAAPYTESIAKAESDNGLPQGLLARLLYQESRYRPDIINGQTSSPAGALGIAQFMPATAAELGVDPLDAHAAIDAAAAYLRSLYDRLGSWTDALGAYNWGIGNVQKKGLAAAPAETQRYVSEISADVGLTS